MVYMLQVEARTRITDAMAALAVGESTLFPWTTINALSTYRREKARKRLGDPQAQWRGATTTKGIRVTRIR